MSSARMNTLGQMVGFDLPGWTPPPFPPHTSLSGRLCQLEPLVPAHAPALWEAVSLDTDGRNWTYLAQGPFERYEDFVAWVEQSAAATDPQFYTILIPAVRSQFGSIPTALSASSAASAS